MSAGLTPLSCTHLDPTKLSPPPLQATLQRPRLMRQLSGLFHSKLTLLCAEVGYGKTTLILDFLRAWPHPVVWYRLDVADRNAELFAAYLTEGTTQRFPALVHEIRMRVLDASELRTGFSLPLLLNEIGGLASHPVLLVLDNFEAVAASGEICALLSNLLDYSGPNVHIAVVSRISPSVRAARLQGHQEVVEIGPRDLAFNIEETRELLVHLRAPQVSDLQLDAIWRRTEGWPTALLLIASMLRRMPTEEAMASIEGLTGPFDLICRYFEEEVLQQQDAALQEFLMRTSILTALNHDVANELLEIETGGESLAALKQAGAFVRDAGDGSGDLRYHSLFRAFLLRKLHSRHGDRQIRSSYQRAAQTARRYQRWSQAIDLHAAAEDWEELADLIERIGEGLVFRGSVQVVRQWLELVPEERIVNRPSLLMLRGRLLRQSGQPLDALRDLRTAFEAFRRADDHRATVLVGLEIADVHHTLGEFRTAEIVLNEALRGSVDSAALRSRVLAELSHNSTHRDDIEGGVHWGEVAVTESTSAECDSQGVVSRAQALRLAGRALTWQGELRLGLQYIARGVDICHTADAGNLERGWALLALGRGLTLQGELDRARRVLDEAEALAHTYTPLLHWTWIWRGTAQRDAGAFEQAERDFQNAGADYGRAGHWARREMAFLRLRQGRASEALTLAEEAFGFYSAEESQGDTAASRAVLGIALARAGNRPLGLQQLSTAVDALARLGRRQQVASAQWHLARLLLAEGRRAEAVENLKAAVNWASERRVCHFWWSDPETIARLWPMALAEGCASEYLLELARLRLGSAESHFLYRALDTASPALRLEVAETVRSIARGPIAQDITTDLLSGCRDHVTRGHIADALAAGTITPPDLAHLRRDAGLTWREIEIFALYYLQPDTTEPSRRFRHRLSMTLALSEETLKIHVRNIRRKLGLSARRGSTYPFTASVAEQLPVA